MTIRIEPAPEDLLEFFTEHDGGFAFIARPKWMFTNSHNVWSPEKKHFVATRPPQEDINLAFELWKALDPLSRRMYLHWAHMGTWWLPITEADLDECGATDEEVEKFLAHVRRANQP